MFICEGVFDWKVIYTLFAIYITISGEQDRSNADQGNLRPLRAAVKETLDFFKAIGPLKSLDTLEFLLPRYLIPIKLLGELSSNFRNIFRSIGRYICGDEKLYHFTGNSAYVRLVPSKPGRLGLWFYQLTCRLETGDPFLLSFKLMDSVVKENISNPVNEVVGEWVKVQLHFKELSPQYPPILVFDSYYADNKTRNELLRLQVPFICSLHLKRFQQLKDYLTEVGDPVLERGDNTCIRNKENGEVLLSHWSADVRVGLKHVLSSAFRPIRPLRMHNEILPVWDHYKNMFNVCDNFNSNLSDRCFPHKCGGNGVPGQNGQVHKFVMASLLQNIRAIAISLDPLRYENMNFHDFCKELAAQLIDEVLK